jgi:hypothetical protein
MGVWAETRSLPFREHTDRMVVSFWGADWGLADCLIRNSASISMDCLCKVLVKRVGECLVWLWWRTSVRISQPRFGEVWLRS